MLLMTEANSPQESYVNDDYGREILQPPSEKSRCRYVVPVIVCKQPMLN